MEEPRQIIRSDKGLYVRIISTAIVVVIVGLIASFLLTKMFSITQWTGITVQILVWALLIITWGLASLYSWKTWNKKYYEVTDDAVIVYSDGMWKTDTEEVIYRYESIISIRLTQSFWGKRYGYGDIRLTIPKIDQEIILSDIKNPQQQLSDIRTYMQGRDSGATASLIT